MLFRSSGAPVDADRPVNGRWRDLFAGPARRATILASVPWFLQDLGTYGIGIFTPTILARTIGGHAHTHTVSTAGGDVRVDSGFIVHNDRTYPLLTRLFEELGVRRYPTEMSMSINDGASGLEYAGGRGASGVFAQLRRIADPRFLRLLGEVRRFHRRAAAFLEATDELEQTSYGAFLSNNGFSQRFVDLFAVPVVGWWFRSAGHVEVDRSAGQAGYRGAVEAVARGQLVLVYPEGSITKREDGLPMAMKSGAVRIALAASVPLLPKIGRAHV